MALDYRFDERVALRYDALRGHPPDVASDIGAAIVRETGTDALLLEAGLGTGRIALPIIAAGGDVVGVDLSADMLHALTGYDEQQLHLVQGDITRLPFREDAFDAALCVHVLHLVDSRTVLRDLLRLVRPGGLIILGRDWIDPASFAGQIRNQFRQAVVDLADGVAFPTGARGFVEQLLEMGARSDDDGAEAIAVEWETALSVRQVLDGIRSKDDAESWVLPDELLIQIMERLDRAAVATWPDLDATQPVTRRFVFSRFVVPAD